MEASKTSILCVDDNEDAREILTYLLEEKGFAVTACKTLDECLEQARQKHFSLIILDYRFGDGTSLDVCRELGFQKPATPIIFYSGETRGTEIQKALEAGGTEYLVKPSGLVLPLNFSFVNPISGATNTFTGVVNNALFSVQNGALAFTGNLVGQVRDAQGNLVANIVNQPITTTLLGATGTCEILDLTLGPINLDLLGLVITTNQINVRIVAESGPGNLLSNLLCAVAGLLDGDGPLTRLAALLNNILRVLGGL